VRERQEGFVVLHRRIQTWPLWQAMRLDQRMIWVELILAANWKASEVWVRGGRLIVQRGQVLLDQRAFAARIGASRQNVRTVLKLLTQEGAIQLTLTRTITGKKATLVTIVNYEKYQDVPEREEKRGRRSQPGPNPIRTKGTTFLPDPEISSTASPSDDRGEEEQILSPEEWHRRQDERLTRKYGLH
jgi:DNA replication protein DnaD